MEKRTQPDETKLEFLCSAGSMDCDEMQLYKDKAGQYFIRLHINHKRRPEAVRPISQTAAIIKWVKFSAPERHWVKILTGHLRTRKERP